MIKITWKNDLNMVLFLVKQRRLDEINVAPTIVAFWLIANKREGLYEKTLIASLWRHNIANSFRIHPSSV